MPGAAISVGVNLVGRDLISGPLGAANIRMRGFISGTEGMERQLRAATVAGAAFAGMVGFKLVASMKNAIFTASRLEDIMISIKRIGGLTSEQIQGLSRDFLVMSAQLPLSAEELARVGVIATRLGVKGTDAIKSLAFSSAQLARSTVLTEESAASALARISRLFKLDVVQSANAVSSAMVAMDTSSTATAEEISDITVRMGGMASVMGMTSDQAMALAATMRDAGLRVEMSGSAIIRILNQMTTRQEAFAKFIGITTDSWKEMVRASPMDAFMAFLQVVSQMDKMEVSAKLKELGLNNVRTSMTVLGLSQQLGTLQRNLGNARMAFEQGTKVSEMYEMATKSLNAKIATFSGSVKNVFILTGNYLLPIFKVLLQTGINILSVFLDMPKAVHMVFAALFLLAGIFGLLMLKVAALMMSLWMFSGVEIFTAGSTAILTAALDMWVKAMGIVFNVTMAVVQGMKNLVVRIWQASVAWVKQQMLVWRMRLAYGGLESAMTSMWKGLGSLIQRGLGATASFYAQAKAASLAGYAYVKTGVLAFWSFLQVASGAMAAATGLAVFNTALGPILIVVIAIAAAIAGWYALTRAFMPLLSSFTSLIGSLLVPVFEILWVAIEAVVNAVKGFLFGIKLLVSVALLPLVVAVKLLTFAFNALSFVLVPLLKVLGFLVKIVSYLVGPIATLAVLYLAWANATKILLIWRKLEEAASFGLLRALGFERRERLAGYWLKLKEYWLTLKMEIALYREAGAIWLETVRRRGGIVGLIRENALKAWNWVLTMKQTAATKINALWLKIHNALEKRGITWAKIRNALMWKNIVATYADTKAKILNWIAAKRAAMGTTKWTTALFGYGSTATGATASTGILASAAAALGVSVGVLLGIVVAAIAAVVIFVVAAVKFYKALDRASASMKILMVVMIPFITLLSPLIGSAFAFAAALWAVVKVVQFFSATFAKLFKKDFMGVKTLFKEVKKAIQGIFQPLVNAFKIFKGVGKEANLLKVIFTPFFTVLRGVLGVFLVLAQVARLFVGIIANAIAPILAEVKEFVDFIAQVFTPMSNALDTTAKKGETLGVIFRFLGSVVMAAMRPVVWIIGWIGKGIALILSVVKTVIGEAIPIFQSIFGSLESAVEPVFELLGVFWDQFMALIEPARYVFTELLSIFGLVGKEGGSTMDTFKTIGYVIGLFLVAPLRILSWVLKVNVFFFRIFMWIAIQLAKALVVVFKIVSAIVKFGLWPMIQGLKVAMFLVKAWLWFMILPFKILYWVVSKILDLFFGSTFMHLMEGIMVVLPYVFKLVDAFLKFLGVVKLVAKALGAVWKVAKIGIGTFTAPLKAAGWLAKKVFGGIASAAKKGWETAKAVVTKPVETISKGLQAVGGAAKKAWGYLFGSSFLHIAEGIWMVLPWLKRLEYSFHEVGHSMSIARLQPFGGVAATTATIRHEIGREPVPVKVVTVAAAPVTVPPPSREILEIRARIPFFIFLDGAEIARGMSEIDDFEMVRKYREPSRKFTGICD